MMHFLISGRRVAVLAAFLFVLAACSSSAGPAATWTPAGNKSTACAAGGCPTGGGTTTLMTTRTPTTSATASPARTPTRAFTPTPSDTLPSGFQFTPPSLISQRGMLALTIRNNGHNHLWLWPLGVPAPSPLTSGDFDDRDPDFTPDGTKLAFASHRDGNWDLFTLNLSTGKTTQLTNLDGFHAHPSWSPDAKFLAYENYQDGMFQVCILSADGGDPVWCGPEKTEAMEPDWFPQPPGRVLAFTGRAGAHTDIFTINLETLEIRNLTNTPSLDERDAKFSPDGGEVVYSFRKDGYSWIGIVPAGGGSSRVGPTSQGASPEWNPEGSWIASVFQTDPQQSFLLFSPADQQVLSPAALSVPARVDNITWTSATLENPVPAWILAAGSSGLLMTPTAPASGVPLSQQLVHVDVKAPDPRLNSAVVARFNALRQSVKEQAGWDYLGTLDSAAMDIHTPLPPRELLSWFRTGRAFAVSTDAVRKGWLAVVPEQLSQAEYWRLYLRAAKQDGTQGEPLRDLTWNFDARSSGTPAAFDNGGQFNAAIPQGYFVDLTLLASDSGWQRRPSDSDWRAYYYSIRYWEFLCADGLDWFTAMSELYPPREYLTPTPSSSPTPRPTMHWGPPPTNTRWPTWTSTSTKTPTP
jgi:TolB protein